jgi:hypothetical protein
MAKGHLFYRTSGSIMAEIAAKPKPYGAVD